MTSDVILAYKLFYHSLPAEEAAKTKLVLHTQPVDENGTDLITTIETLCPELEKNILFTNSRLLPTDMNLLYNSCDVVINIASNEGWGLSSTEALMTGVPIINNVTGGLQDQCRFEDENGNWIKFDKTFATNHTGRYKKHGKWVIPVFPASINLQGSVPTPYIFDDRCDVRDVAEAMKKWYSTDSAERILCGLEGHNWVYSDEAKMTADHMANSVYNHITNLLRTWKPVKRFKLYNVQQETAKLKDRVTGIML